MESEPKTRAGVRGRLRGWRERRRRAATERRSWAEQRINEERYNYRGPGAARRALTAFTARRIRSASARTASAPALVRR